MTALWSIAKNTFVQTIRQPAFGFLLFLTFLMLVVVNLPLSGWTMGVEYQTTDQRMLENVGLGTLLLAGMAVAAFAASAAVSREIDDKTALTVISKPVARAVFVLGKFVGVALAVAVFYYLGTTAFLLTVRHKVVSNAATPINWPVVVIGLSAFFLAILLAGLGNYLFGWTFLSSAVLALLITLSAALGAVSIIGLDWTFVPISETFGPENIRPQLLVGLVLMFEAVLVLSAVAVAASTRLGLILTLLLCVGVLFLGSMLPWLTRRASETMSGAGALSVLLPNLTVFYPLDALANNRDIPAWLVGQTSAYFLCYTAGMLAVGMALFQTRPLEGQTAGATLPGAVALISGLGRIAAIILAIVAGVLLTQTATYRPAGLIRLGVLIVLAVVGWWVFHAFGRGRRWAYGLVLLAAVLGVGRGALVWFGVAAGKYLRWGEPGAQTLLGAILAAGVLLVLLLPKTRHHFQSHSRYVVATRSTLGR